MCACVCVVETKGGDETVRRMSDNAEATRPSSKPDEGEGRMAKKVFIDVIVDTI